MPVVSKVRVSPSWGEANKIGQPDYTIESRRVFVSAGYELNYNGAFKTFGVSFSNEVSPLALIIMTQLEDLVQSLLILPF